MGVYIGFGAKALKAPVWDQCSLGFPCVDSRATGINYFTRKNVAAAAAAAAAVPNR